MNAKELRAFRLVTGITAQEVVDALKDEFPKIDKTIISKCENEAYGVELSSAAERVLLGKYYDRLAAVKGGFRRCKKERRKKTRRVSVRLADDEFSRLQQHLKDAGVTAQDVLTRLIETEIATAQAPRNDTVIGKEIATAQATCNDRDGVPTGDCHDRCAHRSRNDRNGSLCECEGACTGGDMSPPYREEIWVDAVESQPEQDAHAPVIHTPCGYRPPVRMEGGKDG